MFGCHRFKQYIYGKTVTVETDHKPLEWSCKKQLDQTPLRLQRLLINLQNYDIQVKYVPGSKLYLADALSRASFDDNNFQFIENETDAHVNMIKYVSISEKQIEKLQQETNNDQELNILKETILVGWPENKSQVNVVIRAYWKYRDVILLNQGILCKGNQFIIPKAMRKEMISRLHYGHLGINKTINKAKELIYCPNMQKEITDIVKNCSTCLKFSNSQTRETFVCREVPTRV